MTHYEESQKPDKVHENMITCFCGKPTQHTYVIKTRCAIEQRPHYCRSNIKTPSPIEFSPYHDRVYHKDDKYEFCSVECIKSFKAMIDHDNLMKSADEYYMEFRKIKKQYVCYTLTWMCSECDESENTKIYRQESSKNSNTNCPNDCWICSIIPDRTRDFLGANGTLDAVLTKYRCNGCGDMGKKDLVVHHIFDDEQLEQLNKRGY